jgi:hypothetical protein
MNISVQIAESLALSKRPISKFWVPRPILIADASTRLCLSETRR